MARKKGWKMRAAAEELGVTPGYIRQLVSGDSPKAYPMRKPMPAHPGYFLEISNAELRKLKKFLDRQSDLNKRKRRPENGKEQD